MIEEPVTHKDEFERVTFDSVRVGDYVSYALEDYTTKREYIAWPHWYPVVEKNQDNLYLGFAPNEDGRTRAEYTKRGWGRHFVRRIGNNDYQQDQEADEDGDLL